MRVGQHVVIGDLLHSARGRTGTIVAKHGMRFKYEVELDDTHEHVRCSTPRKA